MDVLLSKVHKANFFQICVSDLCRLLGMTVVEKKRGLWNRVVGEVERDRERETEEWDGEKEREGGKALEHGTILLILSLSLFHAHTQKHKKD